MCPNVLFADAYTSHSAPPTIFSQKSCKSYVLIFWRICLYACNHHITKLGLRLGVFYLKIKNYLITYYPCFVCVESESIYHPIN
jgi:hypothetical protein